MPTPIINQQLEDLKDSMDDIKEAIENLPFAGVPEAVADWLDDHPEATTTVQDGAITEVKLASALADKIFKPKVYVKKVISEDANGTGYINLDNYIDIYEELTFVIYQSDTTNNGTVWSTNSASNTLTIREYKPGEQDGYLQVIPSQIKGDKPVIIKIRRLPGIIYGELRNGNEAQVINYKTRETTDKDYVSWCAVSANSNNVLKAGCVVEAYISRFV